MTERRNPHRSRSPRLPTTDSRKRRYYTIHRSRTRIGSVRDIFVKSRTSSGVVCHMIVQR
eukprot:scaffold189695_cov21-Prasinocladus_malaysianus.AAC.2